MTLLGVYVDQKSLVFPGIENFYPADAAHAIFVLQTWICSAYREHEHWLVLVLYTSALVTCYY